MGISTVPAKLQLFIQDEKERTIRDSLHPELGFRGVAAKEQVSVGAGETITKFKDGLLAPNDTPVTASSLYSNLDNGMTAGARSGEQFSLTPMPYNGTLDLRKTDNVIKLIGDYELNIKALSRQAHLSLDLVAMRKLYAPYMSGQTFTTATESSSTAVEVDDVTGFETIMKDGVPTSVSATNKLAVTVDGVANFVTGVSVDVTNTARNKAFGARSGVLTLENAVTLGATGKIVLATDRPKVVRPFASGAERASDLAIASGDLLTLRMIRRGVRELRDNGVPTIGGKYNMYLDNTSMEILFLDTEFQNLVEAGGVKQREIADFRIFEMLDVRLITNNVLSAQAAGGSGATSTVLLHRPIIVGADALIEAEMMSIEAMSQFAGGDSSLKLHDTKTVDGISFIDRAPIDRLALSLAQSWFAITDFCAPTDSLVNSTVFPTATNARFKRAVMLVHAE